MKDPSSSSPPSLPSWLESEFLAVLELPTDQHVAALSTLGARHSAEEPALRAAYAEAMRPSQAEATAATDATGERSVRSTPADELLHRLQGAPSLDPTRYAIDPDELGRGGMGRVLCIDDQHLRRQLAMKVMLKSPPAFDANERRFTRQRLGRFLEEAQVTSQLDHPGVPPVHDLGLDADGQVFFTMRLVRGDTADHVFGLANTEKDGWTRTRALEVLLKVCDTMAFAHEKGVLHRDLKPSNVMVGRFGEVYVMDWGLAKIVGQPDSHDLRIHREGEQSPLSSVHSVRKATAPESESSILTIDGQQLGTPSYMPPEQARGETLDFKSDVYAVGAMLYELLTARAPHSIPGVRVSPYKVLDEVLAGPPKPVHALVKGVPAELVAICDKAMARDRAARYSDMRALAADLRAYLDQRTVKAYRTGPVAELKMWVRRNRALAAAAAAAVVILIAGVVAATTQKNEAKRQEGIAAGKVREFDQLAGVVYLKRALETEKKLYPAWPHKVADMQRWLAEDVGRLLQMQPVIGKTIADLRTRAPALADESQSFLHDTLTELQGSLTALEANERKSVLERLSWAKQIEALTLGHPRAHVTWQAARDAIKTADGVVASALYKEHPIDLPPQMGLVPIGMNPQTKLWEFYDLRSAADPQVIPGFDGEGHIAVDERVGIVLVLLPGGTYRAGTQKDDDRQPNYWRDARPDEYPPTEVTIAPFFLGRCEVTRGQWRRLMGSDPSFMRTGAELGGKRYDDSYPVTNVSWIESELAMRTQGMRLPAENEWEYACRAGTSTAWFTGDSPASLAGYANIADETAQARFTESFPFEKDFRDGWIQEAPVGTFKPNDFGLCDMHGNVLEWCADAYVGARHATAARDEPLRADQRVARGGSWWHVANNYARSAYRHASSESFSERYLGLRAARALR